MHGSIFVLFKRFVETKYDFNTWVQLAEKAKVDHQSYDMHKIYPDEEIKSLVLAASEMTSLSVSTLQEEFGEAIVPDLLFVYKQFIKPEWKTLDIIEYTEQIFHKAARDKEPGVSPPVLTVTRVEKHKLTVDYFSNRRMGSLAIGIIKGLAKYYHEENEIKIIATTAADAEKVQILVEYHPKK